MRVAEGWTKRYTVSVMSARRRSPLSIAAGGGERLILAAALAVLLWAAVGWATGFWAAILAAGG